MLIVSNAVRQIIGHRRRRRATRRLTEIGLGVVMATAVDAARYGAVAARLSRLASAGLPVVPTLLLDADALTRWRTSTHSDRGLKLVAEALDSAGPYRLFGGCRARSFAAGDFGDVLRTATGPVLMQDAVLHTAHVIGRTPALPGQLTIVVDGRRSTFGRLTGRALSGDAPVAASWSLLGIYRRAEAALGAPFALSFTGCDREWRISACMPLVAFEALDADVDRLVRAVASEIGREPAQPLFQASETDLVPLPTAATLDLLNAMADVDGRPRSTTVLGRCVTIMPTISPRQRVKRWRRRAELRALAHDMREVRLPRHHAAAARFTDVDFSNFSAAEILHLWHCQRATCLAAHADAELVATSAREIERRLGDANSVACIPTARWEIDLLTARLLPRSARELAMRRIAGHRATLDLELAQPRYRDIPGALTVLADVCAITGPSPDAAPGSAADMTVLTLDARHEALRHVDILRLLLLDLDRKFGLGGKIFDLKHDEIAALTPITADAMRDLAHQRCRHRRELAALPAPPAVITADVIERLTASPALDHRPPLRARGRGRRVAGSIETVGRAYVALPANLDSGADLADFRSGDVLVTPYVHRAWFGVLGRSSGVVSETADEDAVATAHACGIAMIVDIPNCGQFRHGDLLMLHLDGRVTADASGIPRWRGARDSIRLP